MKIIITLFVAISLNLFSPTVLAIHDGSFCNDDWTTEERKESAGCYDSHDDDSFSPGIVLVGLLAFYALKGDFDSDSFARRQLASFASGNGFVLKETKYFSIHAYEISKLNDTELNNDFDRLNYNPNRVNLLKFKVKL